MRRGIVAGAIACVAICGCGTSGFRGGQDWSGVEDSRLLRTVHVTEYGSGILLAVDGAKGCFYVLTCAHLVEEGRPVDLWAVDPEARRYVQFRGEVVGRSHPHREDLALVRARLGGESLPAYSRFALADPVDPNNQRRVSLMNTAFGAEDRPFVLDLPLLGFRRNVSTAVPDEQGGSAWTQTKGLLYGGITEANSGSPVFAGNKLLGLVESSPGFADAPGSADVISGVVVSTPQEIETFLRECGHDLLIRK